MNSSLTSKDYLKAIGYPASIIDAVSQDELDAHPAPIVCNFNPQMIAFTWPSNRIGATERVWSGAGMPPGMANFLEAYGISILLPGQSEGFHSHLSEWEGAGGPYDEWYIVLDGELELRTEYGDFLLKKWDGVYMTLNAAHQIRNPKWSTKPAVYMSLSCFNCKSTNRWDSTIQDKYGEFLTCSEERFGYMKEYKRITKKRRERVLPADYVIGTMRPPETDQGGEVSE